MAHATVTLGTEPIGVISPRLYGAFAEHLGRCCYGGLWVGPESEIANIDGFRTDVVEALRELPTPLMRWPGGCYAEHYHWRSGIGLAESRAASLGLSCGLSATDTHALGTHEFMRFCELIGAEPYLTGNVATGSVQELCDWIEYVNSSTDSALIRERGANGRLGPWGVKLWGIGNENWDCGGRFDAVSYAHEYRRFARMIRDVDPGAELVAVGLEDEPLPESHLDPEWNARFLRTLGPNANLVDHLSVHKYWLYGGPEIDFDESQYYALLDEAEATEGLIERTRQTIESIAPPSHRIGIALDEWGVWHPEARDWGPGDVPRRRPPNLEQANTLRDALAVGVAFEGFHRQCNVLSMTNLAQVVNVLQAVLLTDGPRFVRTPTYYAIALHKPHVGAQAIPVGVSSDLTTPSGAPSVSATGSVKAGSAAVTIMNRHWDSPAEIEVRLPDPEAKAGDCQLLGAARPNSVNRPGETEEVALAPLEVEVLGEGTFRFSIPAHAMATLEFAARSQQQVNIRSQHE
jgi:alpha-L-arabinofuranosidase